MLKSGAIDGLSVERHGIWRRSDRIHMEMLGFDVEVLGFDVEV